MYLVREDPGRRSPADLQGGSLKRFEAEWKRISRREKGGKDTLDANAPVAGFFCRTAPSKT
jgi:hypothetical protein